MSIRADSILQMVRKLATTYEEIVAEGQPDKRATLEQIDQALADAFRSRPETLHMQVDHGIDEIDERLAAEVGRLLILRARVADELGNAELSDTSLEFACRSLLEAAELSFHGAADEETTPLDLLRDVARSDRAADVMTPDEIAEIWRVAFRIEADRQHFPAAEDALFHALELTSNPGEIVEAGIAFYERLRELPDEVLERRGLPRQEVEAALEELTDRSHQPPD
ncbi:MAG: DUF6483 family protein [Bradymonadaceae bacterium]